MALEISNKTMKVFNQAYIRYLHYALVPVILFPVLLTLITGSLFQIAVLTNQADKYIWLLDLHRGTFGSINLDFIYPFLNSFGLLFMVVTGFILWLSKLLRMKRPKRAKS